MNLNREIMRMLMAVVLLNICQVDSCVDNETLGLENDGHLYEQGKGPLISALYQEWWLFTLYDPKIDVGFCVGYSVRDPGKTFGLQGSSVGGLLWNSMTNNTGQDPIDIADAYNFEEFNAYKENATVTIGSGKMIKVTDKTTYEIVGSSRDEKIRWSLTFKQYSYAVDNKKMSQNCLLYIGSPICLVRIYPESSNTMIKLSQ